MSFLACAALVGIGWRWFRARKRNRETASTHSDVCDAIVTFGAGHGVLSVERITWFLRQERAVVVSHIAQTISMLLVGAWVAEALPHVGMPKYFSQRHSP